MEMARYQGKRLDRERGRAVSASRHVPVVRLLLLAAALTGAAMLGGTTARYLKEWSAGGSLVTAEGFYFASTELDGAQHRLTADDGGLAAEFSFTLRNYIVAGYATQSAITYTCAVTDEEGNAITDASGAPVTVTWSDGVGDGGSRTLEGGGDRSVELTCSIPVAAFGEDGGRELTVSARSSKPYARTLTAGVTLAGKGGGVEWEVTDPGGKSGAVSVTLYNTSGRDLTVTLKFAPKEGEDPLALVADPTWETVPDGNDRLTIPKDGVAAVIYLKKNTESHFTKDSFELTLVP